MSIHQSNIVNVPFNSVSGVGTGTIYDTINTIFPVGVDALRNFSSIITPVTPGEPNTSFYSGQLNFNIPAVLSSGATRTVISPNPIYTYQYNSWLPGYGQTLSVYGSVLLGTVAGLPDALLTDGKGHLLVNVTAINDPVTVQEIVDPVTVQEIVNPVTVQEIVDPVTVQGSVAALGNGAASNNPFSIALSEDFNADFPNAKPVYTTPIGFYEGGGFAGYNFVNQGALLVATQNYRSSFNQGIVEVTNSNNLLYPANDVTLYLNIRNNDSTGKITICFNDTAAFGEGIVIGPGESYEFGSNIPYNDIYAIGDIPSNPNIVIINSSF